MACISFNFSFDNFVDTYKIIYLMIFFLFICLLNCLKGNKCIIYRPTSVLLEKHMPYIKKAQKMLFIMTLLTQEMSKNVLKSQIVLRIAFLLTVLCKLLIFQSCFPMKYCLGKATWQLNNVSFTSVARPARRRGINKFAKTNIVSNRSSKNLRAVCSDRAQESFKITRVLEVTKKGRGSQNQTLYPVEKR